MHIDSFSFGSMTIEGVRYSEDLIVFPEYVSPGWIREEGHKLGIQDLREVIEEQPEMIVIGKGAAGCMKVPPVLVEELRAEGIEVICANTKEAIEIFNEKTIQGRKVIGAFHLTC